MNGCTRPPRIASLATILLVAGGASAAVFTPSKPSSNLKTRIETTYYNTPILYPKGEGIGDRLFATGGEVTISNLRIEDLGYCWVGLALASPLQETIISPRDFEEVVGILTFHKPEPSPVGSFNLGAFSPGTEIVFKVSAPNHIYYENDEKVVQIGWSLFTGPGSRNPDRAPHARVLKINDTLAHVGFFYQYTNANHGYFIHFKYNQCEFDVSGVSVNPAQRTHALAFVNPPTTLPPTIRARSFPDGDALRSYDLRLSVKPRRIVVQATEGSHPPTKPMRIRVSVRAIDAGEGRDPAAQTQPRPHGWISRTEPAVSDSAADSSATNPAFPDAASTEPESLEPVEAASPKPKETVPPPSPIAPTTEPETTTPTPEPPSEPNAGNVTDSSTNAGSADASTTPQPSEDGSEAPSSDSTDAPSGFFDPSSSAKELDLPAFSRPAAFVEPGGETRDSSLVLTADADGRASFYYTPSEIAGTDLLVAELLDDPYADPALAPVRVRVEGLVNLDKIKFAWAPVRTKAEKSLHPDARWATPATVETLKRAAKLYVDRQTNDRELQGWIATLAKKGYDFPFDLAKNRVCPSLAEPLLIQDLSLPGGGLFDVDGSYSAPHGGHRDGTDADFQTKQLARGDPEKATLAEATGDSDLVKSGDVERNDLVRKVQLRRLELLMKSLKEAGGRIVREDIDFHETLRHGEYLHVSFRPADSETKDGDGKSAPLKSEADSSVEAKGSTEPGGSSAH